MQPQPRTAHLLSPAPSWYHTPPNIVDPFADLLALLGEPKRRGMISWIAVRYYDGWRPGREEIADLVAVELGSLSVDECISRGRQRRQGARDITDITPLILRRQRHLTLLSQRTRQDGTHRDCDPGTPPAATTVATTPGRLDHRHEH